MLLRKGAVIFERKNPVSLFEGRSLLRSLAPRTQASHPIVATRVPEFLTRRDFFRTSWWSRLATLFSRYPTHLTFVASRYFQDLPVRPRKFASKQLGVSAILHF